MAVQANHTKVPDLHKIRRALISVSDKQGLVDLAHKLDQLNIELISTGGTAQFLKEHGLSIKDVSSITGFPEIMDGRVKTLHPQIHGGLLAIDNDPAHQEAMRLHKIEAIDLLIVNLYPFETAVMNEDNTATIIENIDIGGPAMIRAAAKNHAYKAVITDPKDYNHLLANLDKYEGYLPYEYRRELAAQAFARTASYDAMVAQWFNKKLEILIPERFTLTGKLNQVLRYGENPHQNAGFYITDEKCFGVATAKLVQGKQLSYNNINDTDAAFNLVGEFCPQNEPAVAIIKHANPCGVAVAENLTTAYLKALACDPVSAFGGIIALNQKLNAATAREIVKIFTEVIIAPDADDDAKEIIANKKNLRLLLTGGIANPNRTEITVRSVSGGLLVQNCDNGVIIKSDLKVVTNRQPSLQEMNDLIFAFRVAKHVKSNAIVYAQNNVTLGIGAGQMSRIDSVYLAARKAQEMTKIFGQDKPSNQSTVMASDAFFPFADGLLEAIKTGVRAIIQPGGSIRDEEVIKAADDHDIAMIFTGMRHFRH